MAGRPAVRAPRRTLVLGGGSEIALAILGALSLPPDAEVLLAGRHEETLLAAAKELPCAAATLPFDAIALDTHQAMIDGVFADGVVDLVISAAGVLTGQDRLDREPLLAGQLIEANFTGHVSTLLAAAARMRQQGHGTIVVLSSVAAIRPRKANYVYGAAKAGLDAFARGLADALHGTGVRVLLVRPGFVTGRMTAGLPPAPLSSTPAEVGAAVAAALRQDASLVWVPRQLGVLAVALRLVPRPLWRRLRR
ncbi:MAG TPA: SDR family NAD(P)-dependent oxidoreductase [Streptosporangiaceae bacterium]|jgi:decaprenylphospho-beta-D-erythro-pentofuranosid-2-ulose 2-reductase